MIQKAMPGPPFFFFEKAERLNCLVDMRILNGVPSVFAWVLLAKCGSTYPLNQGKTYCGGGSCQ